MATPPECCSLLAARPNGPKAAKGNTIRLNIDFSDPNSKLLHDPKNKYGLVVENGVLNYGKPLEEKVDATLTLLKATLDSIQLGQITLEDALKSGRPARGRQSAGAQRLLGAARYVPVLVQHRDAPGRRCA